MRLAPPVFQSATAHSVKLLCNVLRRGGLHAGQTFVFASAGNRLCRTNRFQRMPARLITGQHLHLFKAKEWVVMLQP